MLSFFKELKYLFIQLVRPLGVIKYHKISFFLWIMFTMLGGLLGVIVSVVNNTLFGSHLTLSQALYVESANGVFYTYSIAMVATVISSVFIIFSEKKELKFRRYQIPLIAFSIFILLFGGVFYALSRNVQCAINDIPSSDCIVIEWKQLIVFFLSILFSVYSFCVCRLDEHRSAFGDISDDRLKNEELSDSDNNNAGKDAN